MSDKIIKIALLDMYNGEPNQGMRCIIDVVNRFSSVMSFEIFDVRVKCELPDIKEFDIYISTGGPGNPLIGDGNWDVKYYAFIDSLNKWNSENAVKSMYCSFVILFKWLACILGWPRLPEEMILLLV